MRILEYEKTVLPLIEVGLFFRYMFLNNPSLETHKRVFHAFAGSPYSTPNVSAVTFLSFCSS